MSRSGYADDCENWQLICWRGAVNSALRGRRGQQFLREALNALDALPEPKLIADSLQASGSYCTLGAVAAKRGQRVEGIDPYDREGVAAAFDIPHALACEVMWNNDEAGRYGETPRARWERVRSWIVANLKGDLPSEAAA